MHGGDARKDERKAAASCARETVSPYDLGTPLPRDYPYDPRGRRLADGALATVILLRGAAAALAFAGLAWCAIWWAATSLGAAIATVLCITLSALVLGRGLEYAAGAAFGRASLRLEPNVRHDYVLRVFRKGRRSAGTTPRFLLALARLDILRGQPRLASDALARVDTSRLNPDRLKLLYLLQAVTAIQLQEDAHNEAIRYAGITGEKDAGFPPDNVVLGWAQDAADGRAPEDATLRDACASALQPRRRRPLLAVSLSVMLAHCLLFAGVATGVDATDSWRLHLGYQTVAGLLTSAFMVALAIAGVILLARWRRRQDATQTRGRKVAQVVGSCLVVMAVTCLALVVAIGTIFATDGTERIIARAVRSDSADGRPYDYVALDMESGYGATLSTTYWRTRDLLVMQEWSPAQAYDTKAEHNTAADSGDAGTGTIDGSTSATESDDASASPTSSNESDSGTPDADSASALADQMRAVARYLQERGIVPDASEPALGYDAKGHAYASLGTQSQTVNGKTVEVGYELRDNGESQQPSGTAQELVLERTYPNGEGDAELVGFYLVDHQTLTVTDENRTSW